MLRNFLILLFSFLTTISVAQNPLTDKLVYQIPAMKEVKQRSNIEFKKVGDTSIHFDIYYPKDYNPGKLLPLVIFNNGVGRGPKLARVAG